MRQRRSKIDTFQFVMQVLLHQHCVHLDMTRQKFRKIDTYPLTNIVHQLLFSPYMYVTTAVSIVSQ